MLPSAFHRSPLPAFALCLLLTPAALFILHADPPLAPESSPLPTPAATWLGDPEVDPAAARARSAAQRAAYVRWQAEAHVAVYDKFGHHDARWDDAVRDMLRQNAAANGPNMFDNRRAQIASQAACARALTAGCDDPMLRFWALRLELLPEAKGANPADLARLYTRAEAAVAASDYPAMVKFFPAAQTVEKDLATRKAPQGWTGPSRYYHDQAAGWADGTDPKAAYQHAAAALQALVADSAIPVEFYSNVYDDFLGNATCDALGETEVLTPLAAFFASPTVKDHPTYAALVAEGMFWKEFGWDARGGGYAGTVTSEGWKLFGERLEKASAAYEAAWKLDPTLPAAPRNMVIIAAAGPGDMERWFRRAMDAHPDDYPAASNKLNFLQPRWGGSDEALLAFGRQCAATHDWLSRIPYILLDAHHDIAKDLSEDEQATYWKRPDVWADLKKMFQAEFSEISEDWPHHRTLYAIFAFRAGDWPTANEQFKLLHDQPDPEALRWTKLSRSRYHQMTEEAARHVADSAQPDATPAP